MNTSRGLCICAIATPLLVGLACSTPSETQPPHLRSNDVLWTELSLSPDLQEWVQRGGKATYRWDNGEIIGTTAPGEPNSFLCTKQSFADFELMLEFKVDPSLNSGVQIRSRSRPEGQLDRVYGLQVEIDPSKRSWTGGLYEESARGWLDDLKDSPQAQSAFKQGEWNAMRVVCQGPNIQTWINDVPCAQLLNYEVPEGFIGLQVHSVGNQTTPLEVRWRSVKVRPLPSS